MTIKSKSNPVFIRWGHEMERVAGRYPWATAYPDQYLTSYNYYVWSPAGESNLHSYWPGSEYVDYIGLSVYEYKDWSERNLGKFQSFNEVFAPKYDRVTKYNKPIMIAEFGVAIDDKFQNLSWLKDSLIQMPLYKQ